LKSFSYTSQPTTRLAVREGAAEWLRMRSVGQLQNLTPQQRAAAACMENLVVSRPGLVEKLDRVRDLFTDFAGQTPSAQFGGLISRTGESARAQITPGETAATMLERTREMAADNYLDDILSAKRAEKASMKLGTRFRP